MIYLCISETNSSVKVCLSNSIVITDKSMYIAPEKCLHGSPSAQKITSWFNFLYFDQNTFWGAAHKVRCSVDEKGTNLRPFVIYDPESVTVV